MPSDIHLLHTLSHTVLRASAEPQLFYVLLEAAPGELSAKLPRLPLNVCLAIDHSASMRGDRLAQVKEAAATIIDQLGAEDYFSLVIFNDRAEVVVPAQRVINKADLKRALGSVEASGGTALASGMALALYQAQRPLLAQGISRLLVLTDGWTYGDEQRCVQIARSAQARHIGLTMLGIGSDWNDVLLETMAAHENSHARYVSSVREIATVFADEFRRMQSIFAQQVQLRIAVRPGGLLRSLDCVHPFITPIPIGEETNLCWSAHLGDWAGSDGHMYLLEVVVPALAAGDHPLLKLTLSYDLPGANLSGQVAEKVIQVSVRPPHQTAGQVDPTVKSWLERLVAYRLQVSAWQDLEAGRIDDATRRLQMAGTRLFGVGEVALAQTMHEEATRLLCRERVSDEGRKRIKFGTRRLMSCPPPTERAVMYQE